MSKPSRRNVHCRHIRFGADCLRVAEAVAAAVKPVKITGSIFFRFVSRPRKKTSTPARWQATWSAVSIRMRAFVGIPSPGRIRKYLAGGAERR